jgi:hypothetical protein
MSYRLNLDAPHRHHVATYLSIDEARALDEHARKRGLSIARTVREVLLEAGALGSEADRTAA